MANQNTPRIAKIANPRSGKVHQQIPFYVETNTGRRKPTASKKSDFIGVSPPQDRHDLGFSICVGAFQILGYRKVLTRIRRALVHFPALSRIVRNSGAGPFSKIPESNLQQRDQSPLPLRSKLVTCPFSHGLAFLFSSPNSGKQNSRVRRGGWILSRRLIRNADMANYAALATFAFWLGPMLRRISAFNATSFGSSRRVIRISSRPRSALARASFVSFNVFLRPMQPITTLH